MDANRNPSDRWGRRFWPSVFFILLLVLAVWRFLQLAEKTREGTTVGRLYQLRQALLLYYQDHNGVFPRVLDPNSPFGRYLEKIPTVDQLHPRGRVPSPAGEQITYGKGEPEGYGQGWYYNTESGQIYINSRGLDSRGIAYTTY